MATFGPIASFDAENGDRLQQTISWSFNAMYLPKQPASRIPAQRQLAVGIAQENQGRITDEQAVNLPVPGRSISDIAPDTGIQLTPVTCKDC